MTSVRTNLGPLTTPFAVPAHCTVAVWQCSTCGIFWQAQTCSDNSFNSQGVQDDPQCWPPRANDIDISTGVAVGGWGIYSPGTSCPTGYATSCVATGSIDGGFPFQFEVLESETAIGCCPTGFQCVYTPGSDNAQTCYSVARTGSFPVVGCSSGTSNDFHYHHVPVTVTVTETVQSFSVEFESESISYIDAVTVYAPLFQIHYQSTDLSLADSVTGSSSSASGGDTTARPSISPSLSASPSNNAGLSTAAKAGIGVGVGLGGLGLLLLSISIFLYRRRRGASGPVSELMATNKPPPVFMQQQVPPAELSSYPHHAQLPS
ncbi:hypothetical protein F5Y08DRAFT_299329 [Xylaria arbuscula]|nr:hypothetical protein F5Y08DRAFT_299329 [Xylaria arbuscula]